MNIHELAEKNYKIFPSYRLVDYYDAAFPSYALIMKVMVEVQRPLPVVDEFVLKSIEAGMRRVPDIADLLGLDWSIVEATLIGMLKNGLISIVGHSQKDEARSTLVALTKKGEKTLSDLLLIKPEISSMNVCLDAITNRNYHCNHRHLLQGKDVKDFYHVIPGYIPTPVIHTLDIHAIKRIYKEDQRLTGQRNEKRQLLDVLEIEKQWTGYRIMRVFQFVRPEDGAIQVLVYDRNERSHEHEQMLVRMESEKLLPLRAVYDEDEQIREAGDKVLQTLGISREQIDRSLKEKEAIPEIKKRIQENEKAITDAKKLRESQFAPERERQQAFQEIEGYKVQLELLEKQLAEIQEGQSAGIEVLQMHEHRPRLIQAFSDAKKQLIIISPWLRDAAIDSELLTALDGALKRGVDVLIGYGLGDDWKNDRSIRALRRLGSTKKKGRNNKNGKLQLRTFKDVHSKVLICDDEYMIISSFNWLSFGGNLKRGSRVEDGIVVRDKDAIYKKKQEWLDRLTG